MTLAPPGSAVFLASVSPSPPLKFNPIALAVHRGNSSRYVRFSLTYRPHGRHWFRPSHVFGLRASPSAGHTFRLSLPWPAQSPPFFTGCVRVFHSDPPRLGQWHGLPHLGCPFSRFHRLPVGPFLVPSPSPSLSVERSSSTKLTFLGYLAPAYLASRLSLPCIASWPRSSLHTTLPHTWFMVVYPTTWFPPMQPTHTTRTLHPRFRSHNADPLPICPGLRSWFSPTSYACTICFLSGPRLATLPLLHPSGLLSPPTPQFRRLSARPCFFAFTATPRRSRFYCSSRPLPLFSSLLACTLHALHLPI